MAEVPKQIAELLAKFDQNLDAYRSPGYGETEVRVEFINPFFEALGWDITNRAGYAEAYKDVIHEDAIKVGGATKAPDYSFRVGGARKFFLEAKKPAVTIKDDTSPAYQLRRYAWSAKLPLSILINFAEFAVYDCRLPPKETDKASTGRVLYLTYKEYESRWEEIAKVFSKEAVLQGSFDKFAESGKGKRGTSPVDAQFLAEIESWREALAKNLALRNPRLSVRDLNFAVQRTIDRIIFLRMCEDRGIEHYGQLQALLNGENTYKRLQYLYGIADDKYNSGLFHFKEEKGRAEAPDELTLKLKIDDKVLKDIIRRLYYPESPYEFSVLGADILGNVYEQFLGKVIRLTAGHHAVVEEKPEVKKAGGVYYTPAYIVDYIVKNTVGKLCEGKSPKQIEKLRILDPACGSGSFLIGAYTSLLNYHLGWYVNDGPQKHTKEIYQGTGGQWRLTTQEKKRTLLNNIYGVDIDSQAVEVTKLSLLLKVLEGESEETIGKNLKLFRERALPDLGNNIKCGNSLIGPDFYKNQQMSLLDEEERYRINVFDWNSEFPAIMKSGGFDAVIGNPPWGVDFSDDELEYFRRKHRDIIVRMIDSFMFFSDKALSLMRLKGIFGMILPDVILYQVDNLKLRNHLLNETALTNIVNLGNDVFAKVTRPSCILLFWRGQKEGLASVANLSRINGNGKGEALGAAPNFAKIKQSAIRDIPGLLFVTENLEHYSLLSRIQKVPNQPLSALVDDDGIQRGVSPDLQEAFVVTPDIIRKYKLEREKLKPVHTGGKELGRYFIRESGLWLIYTSRDDDFRHIPNICRYIQSFKSQITCREVKEGKHPLFALHRPRKESIFTKSPKVVGVITGDRVSVTIDRDGLYFTDGLYLFSLKNSSLLNYAVGILNSRLFIFLYRLLSLESGRVLAQVKPAILDNLPMCKVDLSDQSDRARYEGISVLVERMLDLHKQLAAAKNPNDKTHLQREIEATDRQIDQLVYELYGLTEEEIKVVEEAAKDKGVRSAVGF